MKLTDRRRKHRGAPHLFLEPLEHRRLLAAEVLVTEFSASNDDAQVDGHGNSPDWIEIYNPTVQPVDLAGYHLTNDLDDLSRWTFPGRMLEPGEYHVVFASGQESGDYVDPGGYLHTNFTLPASGGQLALTSPDGTVLSQFGGPTDDYPAQLSDVSYGVSQRRVIYDAGSPSTYFVPLTDLGTRWTELGFDARAHGFTEGTASLGFETKPTDRTNFVGEFQTELSDRSHAVYTRMEFDLVDATFVTELDVRIKYDDGFVAYLNGTKVAEANAPANPGWFSTAVFPQGERSRRDSEALQFVDLNLTDHVALLVDGANVLAIHGLNGPGKSDKTDMLLVSELTAVASDPLAAFGSEPKVGYMPTPTPGLPNVSSAEVFSGFVADTRFSVDRGIYDEPIQVEIATATAGAEIRYTIDGSAPTADQGLPYTGPIQIDGTTTLRAAAFRDDFIPTNVDTHTYLYLNDVIDQPDAPTGYPNTWSGAPADYGMDPDVIGPDNLFEDRYRNTIIDDLKSLPTLSLVFDPDDMFGSRGLYQRPTSGGDDWERPTSVELISADGSEEGFHINSGIRIMGGSSRQPDIPKHSFRLEFREQYGAGTLQYPLFEGQPFAEDATDTFDELVVRTGFNNSWMHRHYYQGERGEQPRNQWVRDLQLAMGHASARGRFVHVYLNGMYWGIYNLQERPASPHMAEYYGGDKNTDWDVINSGDAVDGDRGAWTELMSLVNRGVRTSEDYAEVEQRVDIVNLIDYMILNFYIGNTDWDGHNWIAARRRSPEGQFRFYAWDSEFAISLPPSNTAVGESAERQIINVDKTGQNSNNNPSRIHQQLSRNSEYRLLFADRMQKHMRNDGVLTPEKATEIFLARSDQLDRAVVAESARWGDYRRDVYPNRWPSARFDLYHRDEHYVNQREFIVERYLPVRTDIAFGQMQRRRLYPDTPAPVFNQHGGAVAAGFTLQMTAGDGTAVYYTTDGSDPRDAATDGLSPNAILYDADEAFTLDASSTIKARALNNGDWSALNEATFYVNPADNGNLRITEINFNPYEPTGAEAATDGNLEGGDFEFIELQNVGTASVSLGGLQFTRGIEFSFPFVDLGPGELAVIVNSADAFALRYGPDVHVLGQYQGSLGNGGERLTVEDSTGQTILDFSYDDNVQWPQRADGAGASLELIDAVSMSPERHGKPYQWRGSTEMGGTPGGPGAGPVGIVINEVLSSPVAEQGQVDAIELLNTTGTEMDIGGWFLSDTRDDLLKFRISDGTTIGPGEYFVLTENDFNPTPTNPGANHFGLSGSRGDDVWLVIPGPSGAQSFVDDVHFGAAPAGESLGRVPDGAGALAPLHTVTLGRPNSAPPIRRPFVSEVNYHPGPPSAAALAVDPTISRDDLEFVELYNSSGNAVDLSGWRLAGGVRLDFDASTVLNHETALLILSFNPNNPENANRLAALRAHYGLSDDVLLVGGYRGRLSNSGELVRLEMPRVSATPPESPSNALVPVDEVAYDDLSPWPIQADGLGESLLRKVNNGWGNTVTNWMSGTPTPGTTDAFFRLPGDTNQDRRFDELDLVLALQGGKYMTGQYAQWSEGDWNRDGVFDQNDFVDALATATYLQGPYASTMADRIFARLSPG